jgi:hypothetical protein
MTDLPHAGEPAAGPASASDKRLWLSAQRAADLLGIDLRSLPKAAAAARLRIKRVPGVAGARFYLPDVERVAREAVTVAEMEEAGSARPR